MQVLPTGAKWIPGYLDIDAQKRLIEIIRAVARQAPFYTPVMPRTGRPMSVRMTNCGELGWITDKDRGYRYQKIHPATGEPWPDMAPEFLSIWEELSAWPDPPEACLINFYDDKARMGMHQDRNEDDLRAPVVSLSLGDTCLFRIGSNSRAGQTTSIRLASGDAVVLGGKARLCYHGVDRIYRNTSALLKDGGRINLTLRRVTRGESRK